MGEPIKVQVMQGDYLQFVAEEYQTSEDDDIILAVYNGKLMELNRIVPEDGEFS